MPDVAAFAFLSGWPAAAMAALPIAALLIWRWRALQRRLRHLQTTLDYLPQGLCMWSPQGRLMLCNRRYVRMYDMSDALVRPGSSLREVLDHRIKVGSFSGNRDQYIADLLSSVAKGKSTTSVREHKGRFIAVSNQPTPDGGWIATHEDITERRNAERQRMAERQQDERRTLLESALASFRERVEALLRTVGDGAIAMKTTAAGLLQSSDQTTHRVDHAAQASEEASINVEAAAAAATELSSSTDEISRQLHRTTDVVRAAVSEASVTDTRIAGLANAAQKIGDVVKLIRDIAGQTNLLALNATIEAARAGEAGRGFAVVASEVKSLAVQTAKATEDIAALIQAVQSSSGGAVEAIRAIAERMQEINTYTTSVAASVEEQNAATGDISHSVSSAAQGSRVAASVLSDVSGAAAATRTSAETVLNASQSVERAVGNLRDEIETLLGKIAS